MLYTCNNCLFVFEAKDKTERCPDCGKENIRTANDDEKKEYEDRIK